MLRRRLADIARDEDNELVDARRQLERWLSAVAHTSRWHHDHCPDHEFVATCGCEVGEMFRWHWEQAMTLMLFLGDDPWDWFNQTVRRASAKLGVELPPPFPPQDDPEGPNSDNP